METTNLTDTVKKMDELGNRRGVSLELGDGVIEGFYRNITKLELIGLVMTLSNELNGAGQTMKHMVEALETFSENIDGKKDRRMFNRLIIGADMVGEMLREKGRVAPVGGEMYLLEEVLAGNKEPLKPTGNEDRGAARAMRALNALIAKGDTETYNIPKHLSHCIEKMKELAMEGLGQVSGEFGVDVKQGDNPTKKGADFLDEISRQVDEENEKPN